MVYKEMENSKSQNPKEQKKIAILGAGAAGMMAAIEAAKKGHEVHIYDHAKNPGEKIRISGGGRCNFTNKYCTHENFISNNKHFCKSALARYPAATFISMVEKHKISYHEKQPDKRTGQLFCDGKSLEIVDMLVKEMKQAGAKLYLSSEIESIEKKGDKFTLIIGDKHYKYDCIIIATGGPSIPKMGASDFGYRIARQFGHDIVPTTPALVPLTFTDDIKEMTKNLSGVATDSVLTKSDSASFTDDLLFTHRGLSGPAILQISSYWSAGENLSINFVPTKNMVEEIKQAKNDNRKIKLSKFLTQYLPARLAEEFMTRFLSEDTNKNIGDLSSKRIEAIAALINEWKIKPNGSEGYRTAEVTKGGVNTNEIDAKTFESKKCDELYFIGEVVDVTGHLGGHNFQWAWASGYCCGQEI